MSNEISRIKVEDEIYDIKDALLRHQMNVLLGIEPVTEEDLKYQAQQQELKQLQSKSLNQQEGGN